MSGKAMEYAPKLYSLSVLILMQH